MKKNIALFAFLFTLFSLSSSAQITAEFEITKNPICVGEIAGVVAHSPATKTYFWDFGESHTYNPTLDSMYSYRYYNPGTYIIKLVVRDAAGNADSIEKTIRVLPDPQASFSLNQYPNSNGVFCLGTEFSVSQWSNVQGFDSLHWDFGDGHTSEIRFPTHKYQDTGKFNIKLDVVGACGSASYTDQVYVVSDNRAKPELNMYFQSDVFCPGTEVNLDAGLYNNGILTSFTLHTGDGNSTSLDEFTYIYQNMGEYTVMAIAENTCGIDTFTHTITIGNDMDNNPYIYARNVACIGRTSALYLGAKDETFVSAEVDFGDGNTITINEAYEEFYHTYASVGTYTVSAIFTYSNCAQPDTIQTTVNVVSTPNTYPFYVNTSESTLCPNEDVEVYGPYIEMGDTLIYDLGDGLIQKFADERPNISHNYTLPGTYEIKIIRKIVCGSFKYQDSASKSLNVIGDLYTDLNLSTNFSSQEALSCIGDSFTIRMYNYYHPFTNAQFTLPDGSTHMGEQFTTAFSQVGSYPIIASATNLCGLEIKAAYTVELTDKMMTPSIAGYSYPRAQCVNQSFLFDMFTNNATNILWEFGDGNSIENPEGPHVQYLYTKPGTYNVKVTATNGCGETVKNTTLYVEPGPIVAFTASKTQIIKGETVSFTNQSSGAVESIWVFDLDETDTTSVVSPTRKYDDVGVYTVTLFALNKFGCWDTLTKTITVTNAGGFVNENGTTLLEVYPNPSNGNFTIKTNEVSQNAVVQLIDLTGKVLYTKNLVAGRQSIAIDATYLPQATYIIRFQTDKTVHTGRILITH